MLCLCRAFKVCYAASTALSDAAVRHQTAIFADEKLFSPQASSQLFLAVRYEDLT
jgi:hypothetical protein